MKKEQQLELLKAHINKTGILKCTFCGCEDWDFSGVFVAIEYRESKDGGSLVLTSEFDALPMAYIFCKNCFVSKQFSWSGILSNKNNNLNKEKTK